ncbi:MAG: hypothetical protein IKS55_09925 [Oscillospiraceae bacterium]|nr:hypothetical protein [Oscillospiraceae bacterium]
MKRKFPIWLLCLILFALLGAGVYFGIRKVARSGNVPILTNVPVESFESPAVNEAPAAEIVVEPEEPEATEAPADESPALPEEKEETEQETESEPEQLTKDGRHVHHYKDGVCTGCGKKPVFCTGFLPEQYYIEASEQGRLERYSYKAKNYIGYGDETLDKSMLIYVPCGYDESKPYNVLVLMPGGGGTENDWLNKDYTYGDKVMSGKKILDNMIQQGDCEPCIVVCPQLETVYSQGLISAIPQLSNELREFILPYIVENYSTYAKDSKPESLKEARSHFALGGLSDGALFTFEGGMRKDFDLFAGYMALSGNGQPWNTVDLIQKEPFKDLPIQCLFTGSGTYGDWQQNYTQVGYDYFLEKEPRVKDGVNAWHVEVDGEHEWKVWLTDLYNALPLLFQECSVV